MQLVINFHILYHHIFTGDRDYEEGPYYVTIPKGERSADYCIGIMNDTILEDDEVFIIRINKVGDVVLMKPVETRVTILDDECKQCMSVYTLCCILKPMYMLVSS